jgi:hypothetical protein
MRAILDKQTSLLESIDKNLSNDRLIQLSQATLQAKTDKDLNTDNDHTVDALHEIRDAIKKGLTTKSDTGAHQRLDHIKSTLDKSFNLHKEQLATLEKINGDDAPKPTMEQIVEGERQQAKVVELLEKLVKNSEDKPTEKEEKKEDTSSLLGGLGTALAIALGSIAGMVQAQIKAIKFFTNLLVSGVSKFGSMLETALVKLSKWFPSIKNVLFEVEATFTITMENMKQFFDRIGKKATAIFDAVEYSIRNTISKVMNSNITKKIISTFESVVGAVKSFFAPIGEAMGEIKAASSYVGDMVKTVQGKLGAFGEFFKELGTKMSSFGKIFTATAKIVSKLAFPLTIIMTIWDTVKGALEGFEKEGIVGLFSGAIKGLISSLVTAPIDMLKDAVSWILDMFGFDKASKFLDSFSFDGLMKKFVDAVFHPIDTIKSMFETVMNFFENFTIPEMGFTVPIINKKVSIGPFQPFKSDKPAQAKQDSSQAVTPQAKVEGATAAKTEATKTTAPKTAEQQTFQNPQYKKAFTDAIAEGKTVDEARAIAEKATASTSATATAPAPTTAAATAPATTDASAVYNKSSENQQATIANQGGSPNITVSAPTVNNTSNNKQSVVTPQPVRNDDSGFNRYTRQHVVMM